MLNIKMALVKIIEKGVKLMAGSSIQHRYS
jgi:hypothetical protein